jgi:pimeloyl-ACP methyl ester carboxylesterase
VPAPDPRDAPRTIGGVVETLRWRGYTLSYETRGSGDRVCVLIHGLLTPSWINGEIATRLVARGNRVVLFDLLGHGRSDKPLHASEHRLEYAGDQTLALLDHLGLDRAVIGGMSLGANVALEVAARAPERVHGLVCEMPVLERGAPGVMLTLLPLLVALRVGGPPLRLLFRAVQALPRTSHEPFNAVLDTGTDPRAMAAIMHGYAAGPVCPPAEQRRGITAPTLVIGHRQDWMHPLTDAQALVSELPNTTFADARNILEMRARPDRLVGEVGDFLDDVWRPEP